MQRYGEQARILIYIHIHMNSDISSFPSSPQLLHDSGWDCNSLWPHFSEYDGLLCRLQASVSFWSLLCNQQSLSNRTRLRGLGWMSCGAPRCLNSKQGRPILTVPVKDTTVRSVTSANMRIIMQIWELLRSCGGLNRILINNARKKHGDIFQKTLWCKKH